MLLPSGAVLVCLAVFVAVEADERWWAPGRRAAKRSRLRAHAVRHFSKMDSEALRAAIKADPYFDTCVGDAGPLRETPTAVGFFRAVDRGVFERGEEMIGEFLTAFVEAERALGHAGRPYLVDYDLDLDAKLRVLMRRDCSELL